MVYIGSHSAFSRTLAQIYICKHSKSFNETEYNLLSPYFKYAQDEKNAIKIAEKVNKQIDDTNEAIRSIYGPLLKI